MRRSFLLLAVGCAPGIEAQDDRCVERPAREVGLDDPADVGTLRELSEGLEGEHELSGTWDDHDHTELSLVLHVEDEALAFDTHRPAGSVAACSASLTATATVSLVDADGRIDLVDAPAQLEAHEGGWTFRSIVAELGADALPGLETPCALDGWTLGVDNPIGDEDDPPLSGDLCARCADEAPHEVLRFSGGGE